MPILCAFWRRLPHQSAQWKCRGGCPEAGPVAEPPPQGPMALPLGRKTPSALSTAWSRLQQRVCWWALGTADGALVVGTVQFVEVGDPGPTGLGAVDVLWRMGPRETVLCDVVALPIGGGCLERGVWCAARAVPIPPPPFGSALRCTRGGWPPRDAGVPPSGGGGGGGGGASRTPKRHPQEHRPQRPTERSDPTQHAKGRPGDCPGPRKETTQPDGMSHGGGGCPFLRMSLGHSANNGTAQHRGPRHDIQMPKRHVRFGRESPTGPRAKDRLRAPLCLTGPCPGSCGRPCVACPTDFCGGLLGGVLWVLGVGFAFRNCFAMFWGGARALELGPTVTRPLVWRCPRPSSRAKGLVTCGGPPKAISPSHRRSRRSGRHLPFAVAAQCHALHINAPHDPHPEAGAAGRTRRVTGGGDGAARARLRDLRGRRCAVVPGF